MPFLPFFYVKFVNLYVDFTIWTIIFLAFYVDRQCLNSALLPIINDKQEIRIFHVLKRKLKNFQKSIYGFKLNCCSKKRFSFQGRRG